MPLIDTYSEQESLESESDGGTDYLSIPQIGAEIIKITNPKDEKYKDIRSKLEKTAKVRAHASYEGNDWEDLLWEAICRTLEGRVRCPVGLPIEAILAQTMRSIVNSRNEHIYGKCVLRFEEASDKNQKDKIIGEFKKKYESKKEKRPVLITRLISNPEIWTVAGFSETGEFLTVDIDKSSQELWKELGEHFSDKSFLRKNLAISKKRKIFELAASSLDRTRTDIRKPPLKLSANECGPFHGISYVMKCQEIFSICDRPPPIPHSFVEGVIEGLEGEELKQKTGLDENELATVRKRFSRRMNHFLLSESK